jgi:hypothetical protein
MCGGSPRAKFVLNVSPGGHAGWSCGEFGVDMCVDEATIRALSAQAGVTLRAASSADIESLQSLRFPEAAISFYKNREPERYAEIGDVRLWTIAKAIEENRRYVPGAYVAPQGFLVFASNICGDAYCFDVRVSATREDPPVLLLPHDADFEGRTAEEIARYARPVAANFAEFLQKFVQECLEKEPIYP